MNQPSVCAVCLYADRPQFIPQILRSFRSQTYSNKSLLIYDNGAMRFEADLQPNEFVLREHTAERRSIGRIRNIANSATIADIIWTLDSDDWSAPERMAEQVELLQSSGAECVGYNECVFWRDIPGLTKVEARDEGEFIVPRGAEAYVYTDHCKTHAIGSSLCYWRTAWSRRPFKDQPRPGLANGEDGEFIAGLNCVGVSGIVNGEPRLIARVHGGNTSDYASVMDPRARSHSWRRAPEFDDVCRSVFA
jgi:glycosyltransferase involved in cell wall biosynthesis